ncbi:MAG: zinc-finger domain-containing protein [Gammaproteobacteria bacterium]|nr:zinc-finger domain-containing protein [Gammaproteobacteria bacterium]
MSEITEADIQSQIRVKREQLPLSCPNAGTDPAALHPRVYIPLKKPGDQADCPYCGAKYLLTD